MLGEHAVIGWAEKNLVYLKIFPLVPSLPWHLHAPKYRQLLACSFFFSKRKTFLIDVFEQVTFVLASLLPN